MNQTDTPRTNAAINASGGQWSFVLLDCSSELGRELAAVTEQRNRLAEIYPLLAAAWFYGSWKAETFNERKMQEIMEREKWWPWESEDKLLEALQSLTPNAEATHGEKGATP
jgi:hypothetical protein